MGRRLGSQNISNEKRSRLLRIIEQNQGIHFGGIVRQSEYPQSTVYYNLNMLVKEKMIDTETKGMYKLFFLHIE